MFNRAPKKVMLSQKTASQLTDMKLEECEKTTMPYMNECEKTTMPYLDECKQTMIHDVNIEEMMRSKMLMMTLGWCNVTIIRQS